MNSINSFSTLFFDHFTLTLLLRVGIASICGFLIGFERKNSLKPAGIKTHFIVALTSALMMCVSMYGFYDTQFQTPSFRFDPSRVAAGVVSGVGFLGAGSIFMKRHSVTGLTTAAGIWATSGIGLAIGAGMYTLGIVSTVLILIVQSFSHSDWLTRIVPSTKVITVTVSSSENFSAFLHNLCSELHIKNAKLDLVSQNKSGYSVFFIRLNTRTNTPFEELLQGIKNYENFVSFTLSGEKYLEEENF